MGRCPDCPFWVAIEGANEISGEFEEAAVDDPRKPGAIIQTSHRLARRVFQSIEQKIKCDYTKSEEPAVEPVVEVETEVEAPVDLDADAAYEGDGTDLDEAEIEEEPVGYVTDDQPMPQISKADIIQALLQANMPKVMGCMEPFKLEMPMFMLGNGTTVGPDGYIESPEVRAKNAKQQRDDRGQGQYL